MTKNRLSHRHFSRIGANGSHLANSQLSYVRRRVKSLSRWIPPLSLALLIAIAPAANGQQAFTGLQAIGFSKWKTVDVTVLINDFRTVDGNVEISLLPFEFSPTNPFGNVDRFARTLLADPAFKGRLRLTVYLWWQGSKGAEGLPGWDWDLFGVWGDGTVNATFKYEYLDRISKVVAWQDALMAWCRATGRVDRLSISVAPNLENSKIGKTAADWKKALDFVKGRLARPSIVIRNVDDQGGSRVTPYPSEFHPHDLTQLNSRLNQAIAGDAVSNDGVQVSANAFQAWQAAAFARKVSALYWAPEYNGDRQVLKPSDRILSPFSGSSVSANNAKVLTVLAAPNPTYVRSLSADLNGDRTAETIELTIDPGGFLWWAYTLSGTTVRRSIQLGLRGDAPFIGDFDGNGTIDFAVYRTGATPWWYILLDISKNWSDAQIIPGLTRQVQWGLQSDTPMVKNGWRNGKLQTLIGVWRGNEGGAPYWYLADALAGTNPWNQPSAWSRIQVGLIGDVPLIQSVNGSIDYDQDRLSDVSIYRITDGQVYWGRPSIEGVCQNCSGWVTIGTYSGSVWFGQPISVTVYRRKL